MANPKSSRDKDKELQEVLNSILNKANLADEDEADDNDIAEELNRLDVSDDSESQSKTAVKKYQVVNQLPHPRFNASTAIVGDTLFIFSGVWECGEKDCAIDSFYSIDMNKLNGVKLYWEDLTAIEKTKASNSDDEFEDDDEDDDEDDEEEIEDQQLVAEEQEEYDEESLGDQSSADAPEFPDPRPWLPHPKPYETLRAFYVRTGATFLEWAISNSKNSKSGERGKHLKKKSFDLCQDRWWERREQIRLDEDRLEELGGIDEVIERDTSNMPKRR